MANIVYNSSGLHTHVEYEWRPTKQDYLDPARLAAIPRVTRFKARFDIYADEGSPLYQLHYVPDTSKGVYSGKVDKDGNPANKAEYQEWLDSLPKKLNPFLCHFVPLTENFKVEDVKSYLEEVVFPPDNLATLHDFMARYYDDPLHRSAHMVSAMFSKIRPFASDTTVRTSDLVDLLNTTNIKLASLPSMSLNGQGEVREIQPQSIDIGPGATDRASNLTSSSRTWIDKGNPANADGVIETWEIWAATNMAAVVVGTFSGSGTTWDDRDYETWGSVASGSKQTKIGCSTDVVTNDIAGLSWSTGAIERATSGGSGIGYSDAGSQFGAGAQTYTIYDADGAVSIYGTGTEAGNTYEVAVTDGLKAGESTTPRANMVWNPVITDGLSGGDVSGRAYQANPALVDGVEIGDTKSAQASLGVSMVDGIKAGDTLLPSLSIELVLSDGTELGDSNYAARTLTALVEDGLVVGDALAALMGWQSALVDGVGLGDSPTTQAVLGIVVSDGAKLGDTLLPSLNIEVLVTDGNRLGDSLSTLVGWYPTIADIVKAGDLPSTIAELGIVLTDGISLGDSRAFGAVFSVNLVDGIKAGDSISIIGVSYVSVVDSIKLGEAILTQLATYPTIADIVLLGDTPLGVVMAVINMVATLHGRSVTATIHSRTAIASLQGRTITATIHGRTITATFHDRAITIKTGTV